MNYSELRKKFLEKVFPSRPNEWDIEDALGDLALLDSQQQGTLLDAIPTIWPVSHSLCFSFIKEGARNRSSLNSNLFSEWLRRVLASYEKGGLRHARSYMAQTPIAVLSEQLGSQTVYLAENISRLSAYCGGISGLRVKLQGSERIYTDTESLFLPEKVSFFDDQKKNLLYYKMLIAVQASFVILGSFSRNRFAISGDEGDKEIEVDTEKYFQQFEDPDFARDIYQLVELGRVFKYLSSEFPGLIRKTAGLRRDLYRNRKQEKYYSPGKMEKFFASIIVPEEEVGGRNKVSDHQVPFFTTARNNTLHIHELCGKLTGNRWSGGFMFTPFLDRFDYALSEKARDIRIDINIKELDTLLSDFLLALNSKRTMEQNKANELNKGDGVKLLPQPEENVSSRIIQHDSIIVDNKSIELPEEVVDLIRQIETDTGELPDSYAAASFGLPGRGRPSGEQNGTRISEAEPEFIPYDEWDFRRHGYRKNWCSLRERTLTGVQSDFVPATMLKYRAAFGKIKRQFELMRTQEKFSKRRRHGDDIDLDAHIESLGDQKAGLPVSEKLFIRLIRNERSISTLFLVDMSNSTEGWVGKAIKEALVLMCEAMEIVGDKYGIYGFSGMRRMRSEVYKIKDLKEQFTDEVKDRVSAIMPKEYTRMGPPIRHLTQHFKDTEAKSRLLLILSDGKPEDYDDYKGKYAIEDTRKALAEARGNGIHPYCITIDKEAHDYLEYLFGGGNFTFVKDVSQLPSRLTEIYRLLTR